jgi:hypothetical protein
LLYAWNQNSGLAKFAPTPFSTPDGNRQDIFFMVIFSNIEKIEPFQLVKKNILVSCCPWDVQPFSTVQRFNSVSDAI